MPYDIIDQGPWIQAEKLEVQVTEMRKGVRVPTHSWACNMCGFSDVDRLLSCRI